MDWVNILLKWFILSLKVFFKRNFIEDYFLLEFVGMGENCCFIVRCSYMICEVMVWCVFFGDNLCDKKLLSLFYYSIECDNVFLYGV